MIFAGRFCLDPEKKGRYNNVYIKSQNKNWKYKGAMMGRSNLEDWCREPVAGENRCRSR
jgi:hypothetical protein